MSEITRLPSGLTIVTAPRMDAETVALGVHISAGTRDETPSEHGLAHFLEHMAFKGTTSHTAFQTVADIEALGGDINAETSPEMTSYTVRMLADDWRTGLDVLLDIVCNPHFTGADIALEQDVVIQEIAGALDIPDDRLVDGIGLAAFGDHPIGQPVLGTETSVRGLDAHALHAFRTRTHAPQSIVVSAAGAIDHQGLVDALSGADVNFPGTGQAHRTVPDFVPGVFSESRSTHDTHLAIAWPAPAFASHDSMAHAFAVQMLGGGMTSRLFQAIREEAGLAYSVDAYQMIFADCGLGIVQTATSADKVGQMTAQLSTELTRFADTITQQELDTAKRQFRASLAMADESLPSIAARNARQLLVLDELRPRTQLEQDIDAIALSDVKNLWVDTFHQARFAKAAVGQGKALDLWAEWSILA